MTAIFHRKFQKFIKTLKDQQLIQEIKTSVDQVISNPNKGVVLENPFKKYKIRKIRIAFKNKELRIAYIHNKKEGEIVFLLIDSRENFYKKLLRIQYNNNQ